jgi:hypothetical protein
MELSSRPSVSSQWEPSSKRGWHYRERGAIGAPVRSATPVYCDGWVDQNKVPNNLLVNEPSLSTQRIGGRCGR